MYKIGVIGIVVENRAERADDVQNIITRYGDAVISRMGVPSFDRYTGIITVAMEADRKKISDFVHELEAVDGVSANYCLV